MEIDERDVREVHRVWIDAVNAGDLACLLGLMANDAVFLSPGRAPVGRDEFPIGFNAGHEKSKICCISNLKDVAITDAIAYTVSQDSLHIAPRAGGDTVELAGDRLTIYRKQPDGRWLLARDAHTLSLVAK